MKQVFKNNSKSYYFTLLRQIFDWVQFFESVTTDFSNHTDARMFKFYKNNNGQVVMKYKANCLESTWKGFVVQNCDDIFGIGICTNFLSMLPLHIILQPLSFLDLKIISEKKAFVECSLLVINADDMNKPAVEFWDNFVHHDDAGISATPTDLCFYLFF